jgi:predicted amidohydrolase
MGNLHISLIQTDLFWEDKFRNLDMLEKKIAAVEAATQIVVLPEMFTTGFTMQPKLFAETMEGPTVEWMVEQAAQHKIILTGSIIIEEDNKFYNRLLWVLPNGQVAYYNKRHLFAFAGEDKEYTAGNKRLIAQVNGWKICLQICYDLRFPVWSRKQTPDEYDLLLYVANWPERRNHAWKTLLCARAIENQTYVVGVNRVGKDGHQINHSGDSMIVDPLGQVLYYKADDEDIVYMELEKEVVQEAREKFPFGRDADGFTIAL